MAKAFLILISFMSLDRTNGNSESPSFNRMSKRVKSRATGGRHQGEYNLRHRRSANDRYRVGDQIPISITMTNTSTGPLYACISSDLYQNLPKLTKGGEVVPYMKWQSYERLNAQRNNTCKEENLPEPTLLRPNEPTMADWFVLVDSRTSTGAEAWYDSLPPGKYELTIQRRLACCDGPMVESNKISFEVMP